MLRYFAEFENDRFFDLGLVDQLFSYKSKKASGTAKPLSKIGECKGFVPDKKQWLQAMRGFVKNEEFSKAHDAWKLTQEWLETLCWDPQETLRLDGPIPGTTSGTSGKSWHLPAIAFPEERLPSKAEVTQRVVPILISASRHGEDFLLFSEDDSEMKTPTFVPIKDSPDSLLHVVLSEERPCALQIHPSGITVWRRRSDGFASWSLFFGRVLEHSAARERCEVLLPLVFGPLFFCSWKENPLSSAQALVDEGYGRYPIAELRQRFKNAMETLATAVLAHKDVQATIAQKAPKANSHSVGRGSEIALSFVSKIEDQLRVECSRFLYRLLFVFSEEAKGRIRVSEALKGSRDNPPIYSTFFIRKKAAAMRAARNSEWMNHSTFLWTSIQELFEVCRHGLHDESALHVPPFNGQLFEPNKIPLLSSLANGLPDSALCLVIDEISRIPVQGRSGIHEYCDFSTLQVNHLGEVYQWLLEFEPKLLKGEVFDVRQKPKDEPFFLSKTEMGSLGISETLEFVRAKEIHHTPVFRMNPRSTVRSQSGTHFTQAALGSVIAHEGLESVLRPLEEKRDPEAILNLSVLEPCIGIAGIMAQAVAIIAESVAWTQLAKSKPAGMTRDDFAALNSAEKQHRLQLAKRRVVERMVYGVDKKIDAVELARCALWQECSTHDLPLPFLNHRIRTGDSLCGTWFLQDNTMLFTERKIPRWIHPGAEAFSAWEGNRSLYDSFDNAKEHINKAKQAWAAPQVNGQVVVALQAAAKKIIDRIAAERAKFPNETFKSETVDMLEAQWGKMLDMHIDIPNTAIALYKKNDVEFAKAIARLSEYRRMRILGDLATSMYFWPSERLQYLPSPTVYLNLTKKLLGIDKEPLKSGAEVNALKTAILVGYRHAFFHWEVEYPELFLNGKRPDICLSNPPWDMPSVNKEDFWKHHHPLVGSQGFSIASVEERFEENGIDVPKFSEQFLQDRQFASFLKKSGDYSIVGGESDLYRPFVQRMQFLCSKSGSLLLPQSLWINSGATDARKLAKKELGWSRLVGFENQGKRFFPSVNANYTFAVCTFHPGSKHSDLNAVFRLRSIDELEALSSGKKVRSIGPTWKSEFVSLDWGMVQSLSPELALPEVRMQRDLELILALRKTGKTAADWFLPENTCKDFDLTIDLNAENIIPREKAKDGDLPLWRGGHIHIWKPLFQQEDPTKKFVKGKTSYAPNPQPLPKNFMPHTSLVAKRCEAEKLRKVNGKYQWENWRLAWRDVASSTNARTIIVALVPPCSCHGNSLYLHSDPDLLHLVWKAGVIGSLVADSYVRLFAASHVNLPQIQRVPIPSGTSANLVQAVAGRVAALHGMNGKAFVTSQVSETLAKLAAKCASSEGRAEIVDETNALVAVAYTIATDCSFNRSLFEHILNNHFPSVFKKAAVTLDAADSEDDEETKGTPDQLDKDRILALYDQYLVQFAGGTPPALPAGGADETPKEAVARFKKWAESGYLPQISAGFSACTLPEITLDTIEYKEGIQVYKRKFPGNPTVSDVTLSRGLTKNGSVFYNWKVMPIVRGIDLVQIWMLWEQMFQLKSLILFVKILRLI